MHGTLCCLRFSVVWGAPALSSKEKHVALKSLILIIGLVAVGCAEAQAQGERRHEANQQVVQACKAELQQLCAGQKGQQAEQCLKTNESKLSSQCKGAISKTPQQ
jgi:hypothetical protein